MSAREESARVQERRWGMSVSVSVSVSVSLSMSVCLRFNQNPPPQVPDEIHKLALSGNGLGAQVRMCIHG